VLFISQLSYILVYILNILHNVYLPIILHYSNNKMINTNIGVNNQTLILDLITEHNNELTTNDICRITTLHRETVYSNCKELTRKGYIKKDGKFGKYYLTLKAYDKSNLKGYNFIREVTKTIKNSKIAFVSEEEQQIMKNLIEKYVEINQNLGKKSNEINQNEWYNNVIQKEIISFSVLMGAYTTYVFLQALKLQTTKVMIESDTNTAEDIISWLKNSINPSYLFTLFKKLNIISRNDFDRLIKSYEKVFPDLFKQFENINKRMTEPTESERSEKEIYNEFEGGLPEYYNRRKKNKIIKSN
jgi:Fe2+ or Zn2+ uptake regulation protein